MLDFIGTVVITTVIVVNLNAFIATVQVARQSRLILAIGVGLWIGIAVAVSAVGFLAQAQPVPGIFVAVPIIIATIAVSRYPATRAALLSVPMPLLVGLNISRVFGAFFLILAAAGRLSGPFPYSAGWGDVITGAFALPAIWLALRVTPIGDRALAIWNAFGALDLIAAVTLGITSAPGSPLQLMHIGVGPSAILGLPWSLVPTVLVPFYLIVHGIIGLQLRARAAQGHALHRAVSRA
jgi:hypothetical protein